MDIKEIELFESNQIALDEIMGTIPEDFYESDWFKERPANVQQAFRDYPPWGFYRITFSKKCARITGFHEIDDQIVAQTFVPLLFGVNKTVGGHPLAELQRVDKWDQDDIKNIEWCTKLSDPDLSWAFRHPLGFGYFIDE
jgi:hypothetical protein